MTAAGGSDEGDLRPRRHRISPPLLSVLNAAHAVATKMISAAASGAYGLHTKGPRLGVPYGSAIPQPVVEALELSACRLWYVRSQLPHATPRVVHRPLLVRAMAAVVRAAPSLERRRLVDDSQAHASVRPPADAVTAHAVPPSVSPTCTRTRPRRQSALPPSASHWMLQMASMIAFTSRRGLMAWDRKAMASVRAAAGPCFDASHALPSHPPEALLDVLRALMAASAARWGLTRPSTWPLKSLGLAAVAVARHFHKASSPTPTLADGSARHVVSARVIPSSLAPSWASASRRANAPFEGGHGVSLGPLGDARRHGDAEDDDGDAASHAVTVAPPPPPPTPDFTSLFPRAVCRLGCSIFRSRCFVLSILGGQQLWLDAYGDRNIAAAAAPRLPLTPTARVVGSRILDASFTTFSQPILRYVFEAFDGRLRATHDATESPQLRLRNLLMSAELYCCEPLAPSQWYVESLVAAAYRVGGGVDGLPADKLRSICRGEDSFGVDGISSRVALVLRTSKGLQQSMAYRGKGRRLLATAWGNLVHERRFPTSPSRCSLLLRDALIATKTKSDLRPSTWTDTRHYANHLDASRPFPVTLCPDHANLYEVLCLLQFESTLSAREKVVSEPFTAPLAEELQKVIIRAHELRVRLPPTHAADCIKVLAHIKCFSCDVARILCGWILPLSSLLQSTVRQVTAALMLREESIPLSFWLALTKYLHTHTLAFLPGLFVRLVAMTLSAAGRWDGATLFFQQTSTRTKVSPPRASLLPSPSSPSPVGAVARVVAPVDDIDAGASHELATSAALLVRDLRVPLIFAMPRLQCKEIAQLFNGIGKVRAHDDYVLQAGVLLVVNKLSVAMRRGHNSIASRASVDVEAPRHGEMEAAKASSAAASLHALMERLSYIPSANLFPLAFASSYIMWSCARSHAVRHRHVASLMREHLPLLVASIFAYVSMSTRDGQPSSSSGLHVPSTCSVGGLSVGTFLSGMYGAPLCGAAALPGGSHLRFADCLRPALVATYRAITSAVESGAEDLSPDDASRVLTIRDLGSISACCAVLCCEMSFVAEVAQVITAFLSLRGARAALTPAHLTPMAFCLATATRGAIAQHMCVATSDVPAVPFAELLANDPSASGIFNAQHIDSAVDATAAEASDRWFVEETSTLATGLSDRLASAVPHAVTAVAAAVASAATPCSVQLTTSLLWAVATVGVGNNCLRLLLPLVSSLAVTIGSLRGRDAALCVWAIVRAFPASVSKSFVQSAARGIAAVVPTCTPYRLLVLLESLAAASPLPSVLAHAIVTRAPRAALKLALCDCKRLVAAVERLAAAAVDGAVAAQLLSCAAHIVSAASSETPQ